MWNGTAAGSGTEAAASRAPSAPRSAPPAARRAATNAAHRAAIAERDESNNSGSAPPIPRCRRRCPTSAARNVGLGSSHGFSPANPCAAAARTAARHARSSTNAASGVPGRRSRGERPRRGSGRGDDEASPAAPSLPRVRAPARAACAAPRLTRVPEPCSEATNPAAASSSNARTTVPRDKPVCCASARVDGSRSPSARAPSAMRPIIASTRLAAPDTSPTTRVPGRAVRDMAPQ